VSPEALLQWWVVVPGALILILSAARLARTHPALRPLTGPFAAFVVATAIVLLAPRARSWWLLLLLALPFLSLLVRSSVLAFRWFFQRRQGIPPPDLLDSVISVLFYGIGAAAVARYWFGIELTTFLATSAVVGAVVGLALQDTLGNLFAGIALHTEAPFRVGDWVRVGDRDGRVEQVSWRAVRLLTWDGDLLTLPNNEVARHALLNYSQPRRAHSRFVIVQAGYTAAPNEVLAAIRQALRQVDGLLADPAPGVRILAYHDYAIDYEVRYYFRGYEDYRRLEGELYRLVWYQFRRSGIELPYPTRTVHLHQAEPRAAAPDRVARLEKTLRTIDLFDSLTDDELREAAARFKAQHFSAGERIIEEDTPGDSFFLLERGQVTVTKSLSGAPRPLARLGPGEFFGEMALLTGERRTATVTADTDVFLHVLDKTGFQDVLARNPAIAVDISHLLAERRDALAHAQDDVTLPFRETASAGTKQDLLDKIRSYFGI
jgi:small-conductance mechanosensitive channel/CRP-like cAMP-binding protein